MQSSSRPHRRRPSSSGRGKIARGVLSRSLSLSSASRSKVGGDHLLELSSSSVDATDFVAGTPVGRKWWRRRSRGHRGRRAPAGSEQEGVAAGPRRRRRRGLHRRQAERTNGVSSPPCELQGQNGQIMWLNVVENTKRIGKC
ncbi:unnamed protein product [Urochloa humidicola]